MRRSETIIWTGPTSSGTPTGWRFAVGAGDWHPRDVLPAHMTGGGGGLPASNIAITTPLSLQCIDARGVFSWVLSVYMVLRWCKACMACNLHVLSVCVLDALQRAGVQWALVYLFTRPCVCRWVKWGLWARHGQIWNPYTMNLHIMQNVFAYICKSST